MGVKRSAQDAFSSKTRPTYTQETLGVTHVSAFAAAKARSSQTAIADIPSIPDATSVDEKAIDTGTDHATAQIPIGQAQPRRSIWRGPRTLVDQQPWETADPMSQTGTNISLTNVIVHGDFPDVSTAAHIAIPLIRDSFITPVGEYDLEVLDGSVSIYGAILHAKSPIQRVYALTTHALPQILAKTDDTVVRLSPVKSMAHDLGRFSPLFRNIATPMNYSAPFMVLENSSEDPAQRSLCTLETTKQYQTTLTQLAMQSEIRNGKITVACLGGKSTGKSTFARHVCNKLLTRASQQRCLFLDLDPGQPEFGPPGQLYLVEVLSPIMGPAYTHPAAAHASKYKLLAAHTIAATSFKDDPQHYMDCVNALFNHKQVLLAKKSGSCPLIVNTYGWVTGLGARVLCDVLQCGITDTVVIDTVDPVVLAAVKAGSENCYQIDRPLSRMSSRSPADLRQMQTMAYFHIGIDRKGLKQTLAGLSIDQWRPWHVSYDERPGSIANIVSYGHSLDPQFLVDVIEGSIVALVSRPAGDKPDVQPSRSPEGLPFSNSIRPLSPMHYQYHCLAFVRAVDTVARQIHLVLPLSHNDMHMLMHREVSMVRGSFDGPDWALLESVHDESCVDRVTERPWLARREMVGVEGAVWRLRHPPTSARIANRSL